jgi:hypothetical protein
MASLVSAMTGVEAFAFSFDFLLAGPMGAPAGLGGGDDDSSPRERARGLNATGLSRLASVCAGKFDDGLDDDSQDMSLYSYGVKSRVFSRIQVMSSPS